MGETHSPSNLDLVWLKTFDNVLASGLTLVVHRDVDVTALLASVMCRKARGNGCANGASFVDDSSWSAHAEI